MHIFLQGQINIGKTTVIRRTIGLLAQQIQITAGGFCTYKSDSSGWAVYIMPYGEMDKSRAVAGLSEDGVRRPLPEIFDTFGVELLEPRRNKNIIIMDELGFMEGDCTAFKKVIVKCLDGPVPVLGVLRHGDIPWHSVIKARDDVELYYVNEDNRDALPGQIAKVLLPDVLSR